MKPEIAKKILAKNKNDYEFLAQRFSDTRQAPWPELEQFADYISSGDKVLDLGCGNGRLLEVLKDKEINYLGLDNCSALIKIAQAKHPKAKFILGDILNLNLGQKKFDKIFMIAVLHHIPSKELRLRALKGVIQALKKGGFLIITNWNLRQRRYLWYYLKFFWLKLWNKINLDWHDVFIPWQTKEKIVERYYHAFSISELKKLLSKAGFEIVDKYYVTKGWRTKWYKGQNIVIIAKK